MSPFPILRRAGQLITITDETGGTNRRAIVNSGTVILPASRLAGLSVISSL